MKTSKATAQRASPQLLQTRSATPIHQHLHSVHTQWEDPARQDHDYCKAASIKDGQDKMTQCDDIAYFLLQRNAEALLYTGLNLETFDILVSSLEGHASMGEASPFLGVLKHP